MRKTESIGAVRRNLSGVYVRSVPGRGRQKIEFLTPSTITACSPWYPVHRLGVWLIAIPVTMVMLMTATMATIIMVVTVLVAVVLPVRPNLGKPFPTRQKLDEYHHPIKNNIFR